MMLTPEQEKIFEENQNLVYSVINTYVSNAGMYGINDYEDLVQIARVGLCKAIISYKPEKAAFSSYAFTVMRNHLYNTIRNANNEVANNSNSMTDEYVEMNADMAYNNVNAIFDNVIMDSGMDILTDCSNKYSGIAKKGVDAIKLNLLGYSFTDIAQMYDVEPKLLTAWVSRARKKLQKEPALLKLLDRA